MLDKGVDLYCHLPTDLTESLLVKSHLISQTTALVGSETIDQEELMEC